MKFTKSKKITITSIISIVFITIALIIASQLKAPQTEEKTEEPATEIVDAKKEEVLEEEVESEEIVEEAKEEDKDNGEKPQNATETSKNESEINNNTTQVETKPQSSQNSSNSTTTNQSTNSTTTNKPSSTVNNSSSSSSNSSNSTSNNSSNSSSTTKPETQKPVEVTKPVETPQPVKVTGVSTNGDSMTLEIGQSKQMTVSVSPANADNKAVKFTSANTAVATVDANGNIKAIGAGTTVIKATSVENSNIFTSIAVTVNAKKEEVKQPTYTSSTILNRTINELGWCKSSSGVVSYLAETGCNTATGSRAVEFNAHMGNNGVDAVIGIFDSSLNGVVSGVETIIRWMMPTEGQQLINKMHDPNYYGGTHTFDGRKVEVSIESYGIKLRIHPKY